jgi:HD-GYP domain-containing protein (c-di-GMP phosphodiesterase class II)
MVRISDILKKKAGAESPPQPQQPEPGPLPEQEAESQPSPPPADRKEEPGISISDTVMSKSKLLNREECLKLYEEAIALAKKIYEKVKAGKDILEEDLKNIFSYVEKFVDQQRLDNDNMLNLVSLPVQDGFIYAHAVNVSIFCIDLGLGLGYEKNKLVELGIIAMVHDIGMVKFYDLYNQPRRLTEKENAEIKTHPKISAEILGKVRNICKKCAPVVYQEHERIDGSGYPDGLKEEAIDEYARIIGPVDMYEALTHSRPYRKGMNSCDALDIILNNKNAFGRKIMKVLIERLACPFPVGCQVKLNSGEKGMVIKRNLSCSLRPVVEIISSADGESLEKSRIIDLSKHHTIFIKNILEEKKR